VFLNAASPHLFFECAHVANQLDSIVLTRNTAGGRALFE
jgi:hypothetical protein